MSTWRTLFWKEFHEHKWKMLSLIGIVLSVLASQLIAWDIEAGLFLVAYGFVVAVPVFIAMGVASGEFASGSISFVRSLPIPTWQAGLARVVVGWFVLIVPLLIALLVCEAGIVIGLDSASQYDGMRLSMGVDSASQVVLLIVGYSIAAATNLYAWILFTTMNQKTELRAGLIGLVTAVLLCYSGIVAAQHHYHKTGFDLAALILSVGPLWWIWFSGPAAASATPWLLISAIQVCTIGVLCWWAIRRYGGPAIPDLPAFERNVHGDHRANIPLKPPLASPEKALMWMQMRESVPIAFCGLGLMLLIAGVDTRFGAIHALREFGPFVGCILALIIGVGSFVPQLQPELHTFWRSRPISPGQWFWRKYLAGALVIVFCFDLPLAVLEQIAGYSDRHQPLISGLSPVGYVCFPVVLHLFIYSFVVLASCGIRHSIYSAVLGVGGILLVLLPPETIRGVPVQLSFFGLWRESSGWSEAASEMLKLLNATMLLAPFIVGSALLAAWLIRRDISAAS